MSRELTRTEKTAIRRLVSKWCANYDRDCGCLPLDCECYMFGKCWTGAYCRYFREAVLPLDPALEAALLAEGPRPNFKACPACGRAVAPDGRQTYCSAACAKAAHRRQQREYMAQGKGPAYERWAKVYNLKQMAAALQYLQEHHLTDYAALTASTEAVVDHFHKLSDELRTTEEALSKTSELMAATVDYAKTRPVFDGYKAVRYSKKYLAQHEAELATYRAAKDTMNTILNGAKLPKIEALKKSRRDLAGQKKELYAEYREAQQQMREAVAIKANIDHLLGITDERENKAQER